MAPSENSELIAVGQRVLQEEAEALQSLVSRLDDKFAQAVLLIRDTPGRVVVTGMGKSGSVGKKLAGTLASTGTPAFFLHPAEALHGDLGMVTADDTILALSYSGETDELRAILPALRRRVKSIISLTGNAQSTLARASEIALDVYVPREACPMNLAPTTSTTLMIALGDALAIAVMEARGFVASDYAQLHPAGSLGRRLLMRVSDIMRKGDEVPLVHGESSFHDALFAITKAGAGAACVIDDHGKLIGILTDGDVRRFWLRAGVNALSTSIVADAMTRTPRTVTGDPLAAEAFDRFENEPAKIGDLPVIDADGRPVGMLMLKDLIRAGIILPDATL